MPSRRFASSIRESLARGENYDDFAYLLDTVIRLRKPYHEDVDASEDIVGWLVCLFVADKPERYVRAMQQFRIRFMGVSTNAELQSEFYDCVRNAAIFVRRKEDVVWRPSLYFTLSRTVHEGLEGWY